MNIERLIDFTINYKHEIENQFRTMRDCPITYSNQELWDKEKENIIFWELYHWLLFKSGYILIYEEEFNLNIWNVLLEKIKVIKKNLIHQYAENSPYRYQRFSEELIERTFNRYIIEVKKHLLEDIENE